MAQRPGAVLELLVDLLLLSRAVFDVDLFHWWLRFDFFDLLLV